MQSQSQSQSKLFVHLFLCLRVPLQGQPDLIYRFLNLASHHSLWNSRKGAAFAATALASREGMEYLKPFLPTLVPLLYRSSYDPNPRVAQVPYPTSPPRRCCCHTTASESAKLTRAFASR
jgi:hypothetical protein